MTDRACLTAFEWVPDFAKGLVRDLRIRWAFEEIDRPYSTSLLNAMKPRSEDYLAWQPFDQVPAFADGDLKFFETGAILLYLAQDEERLLPAEPQAHWNAIAWLFAALNSVEPPIGRLVSYDVFLADQPWSKQARPSAAEMVERKLMRVSDALGDKDWLAGQFSIADIAMVTVLNNLRHTDMVAQFPSVAAYVERGHSRPAYKRALEAQLADFSAAPPKEMEGA